MRREQQDRFLLQLFDLHRLCPRQRSEKQDERKGQNRSQIERRSTVHDMDSRENDIVTHMRRIVLACATALLYNMAALAADYRHASIVIAPGASKPQQKAAQMLAEEIEQRTQLRLKILPQAPP